MERIRTVDISDETMGSKFERNAHNGRCASDKLFNLNDYVMLVTQAQAQAQAATAPIFFGWGSFPFPLNFQMVTLMVHQIMNSTADKTASVTPFIRMQSMIEGMEGTAVAGEFWLKVRSGCLKFVVQRWQLASSITDTSTTVDGIIPLHLTQNLWHNYTWTRSIRSRISLGLGYFPKVVASG